MRCRICNELFYVKRGILDLFHSKKEYICNRCYKKYPMQIHFEAVQLDMYTAVFIAMFPKQYRIDYNLFSREYSQIFMANLKRPGYHVIFLNYISFDEDTLEALDCISKLHKSNIIVLCFAMEK